MIKRIVIFLSCTLFLMELYQFFPKGVQKHFYPLAPDSTESIRWYITELADRFLWFGTMICWLLTYKLTTAEQSQVKPLLALLAIYRGMDLVIYPLNHSYAGAFYGIVYIPILGYAAYITFRKQIWQFSEWLYSKRKKDGNDFGNKGL